MTRLRRMMLEELQRRNHSEITTRKYLPGVSDFAKHFGRSPDQLGPNELRTYQALAIARAQGDARCCREPCSGAAVLLRQDTSTSTIPCLRSRLSTRLNFLMSISRVSVPNCCEYKHTYRPQASEQIEPVCWAVTHCVPPARNRDPLPSFAGATNGCSVHLPEIVAAKFLAPEGN